ncbi:MAG: putative beta-barrel porin 2 [Verrucomicrobiota bacterium]
MRKIVASIGLAAVGATGLQGASVPEMLGAEGSKPWSISATLRGFYDDNINTVKSGDPNKKDTLGLEVSPSIAVNWAMPQTTLVASYTYSVTKYERAPVDNGNNDYDQTHNFSVALDHQFTTRYRVNVKDSFVVGQEPDFLRAGNAFTTFQRVSGENLRNAGSITFSAQITRLLELEFGYANAFFDYADEGADYGPGFINPSRSGLLDRFEHTFHLDTRWQVKPQTVVVVGYQFRQVNYIGNEDIAVDPSIPGSYLKSSDRDDREHYFYLGADHTFRPDLSGSVRIGGRYVDYYKDPTGSGVGNGFGPYAMGSLHWVYAPESFVEAGVSHDLNTTDELSVQGNSFTRNEESTVFYATINHRITPKLSASFTGQFQNSTFDGGANNSRSERYFLAGLQLEYQFNPSFSAQIGYNYDWLDSDANVGGVASARSFDRNRIYVGVTARY